MNISSNLAGRLSVRGGGGSRGGRGGGQTWRDGGSRTMKVSVGGSLAGRLGMPVEGLSVGIRARLGVGGAPVHRHAAIQSGPARNPTSEEYYNPYPQELRWDAASEAEQRRKDSRMEALEARRDTQVSGKRPPSSPVMVKMASGKMVGGLRSDQIQKNVRRKISRRVQSPRLDGGSVVAMDSNRGLTVSLENRATTDKTAAGEPSPPASRTERASHMRARTRWRNSAGGMSGNLYSEHDDRVEVDSDGIAAPDAPAYEEYGDDTDEDIGIEMTGRSRRVSDDGMDVDSHAGDVYNASLLYTRTTTHHHHHHHHGPSPPPQPPRLGPLYPQPQHLHNQQFRDDVSPEGGGLMYRGDAGVERTSRYPSEYCSPPPSPPSFHPRYRYMSSRASMSPPVYQSHHVAESVPLHSLKHSAGRLVQKPAKVGKKSKRGKLMKQSGKKLKKAKQAKLSKKVKSAKVSKTKRLTSPETNSSSSSDTDSASSSSSSSSSTTSSRRGRVTEVGRRGKGPEEGRRGRVEQGGRRAAKTSSVAAATTRVKASVKGGTYLPPQERTGLPEPHKQVLNSQVQESIAMLQGKDPGFKSGPGPGVKNFSFVPTLTTKSLNQRFTAVSVDAAR